MFSGGSHAKTGSTDVGCCPLTITSSPDGVLGYVAGVIDSTVHAIDLAEMSCLARLDIAEPGAHGLPTSAGPTSAAPAAAQSCFFKEIQP